MEPGRRDRVWRAPTGTFPRASVRRCPGATHGIESRSSRGFRIQSGLLPDGRHFVYVRASSSEGKSAIYVGSVDLGPTQQSLTPLVASDSQAIYAPSADPTTGYLLFVRETTLMARPFDAGRLELKGEARPVAEEVRPQFAGATYVAFSVSATNILVVPAAAGRQLTMYDRQARSLERLGIQASTLVPSCCRPMERT